MIKYIIKRLLIMIPLVLGISFIVLILIDLAPGDVAKQIAGAEAEEWQVEQIREDLHLNDPLIVRYVRFVGGAFRGSLGKSFITKTDVMGDILKRFPYTVKLATMSILLAMLIGIPIGIYAATHQYSWKDNAAILLSLFSVSMPSFWFALILVQLFAVKLGVLPPYGIDDWKGWILPTVSLALGYTASIARQTRSNMLEVIRQDYITTAKAKGVPSYKVLFRHALKNALTPIITVVGGLYGMALGGALVAETIFSVPGLGKYTLVALTNRDYPAIQGSVLFISILHCIVILLIDILFAFVDPRIRSQYSRGKKRKSELKGKEA